MLDVIEIAGCNAEYNINADCVDLLLPNGHVYRCTLLSDRTHVQTVFEMFTQINSLLK